MRKNKQNKSFYSITMIAMLSLFVFACEFGGGGGGSDGGGGELGTSGNPFLVDSAETLQKILSEEDDLSLSAHYKQEVDIVLTDANWIPIGSSSKPFTGTYNGNNKKISKLKIDAPSSNNLGLFGYIGAGGTVKNLGLEEVEINGGNNVGSVAGTSSGTVENCYVTGDVKSNSIVGGLVGENHGVVQNCYSSCSITGGDYIGGVVGYNYGTVLNCYAVGIISGDDCVGGVVGFSNGTVQNCVALNPEVKGSSDIGRVVGMGSSRVNNYARSDMKVNGSTLTSTNENSKDGTDLLSTKYYDPSWWTDTAKWSFGETDVWNAPSGTTLPTLKNMLTGDQNPTVQPVP